MTEQAVVKDDRSLGDLFTELAGETSTLIRHEVALVQTELTQKAVKVGINIGFLVIGGAFGFAALLAILTAVIVILTNFIPLWLSALLVGIGLGVIAVVLVSSALKMLKETTLVPQQTIETIKEDAQWLKKQV